MHRTFLEKKSVRKMTLSRSRAICLGREKCRLGICLGKSVEGPEGLHLWSFNLGKC